jgi:hypothetical protein
MTLTNEMSRITTDFEASQGERLASVAKIRPGVVREKHLNRASLKRTMAAHRVATKNSLRDLFGMAAFTRGTAVDLIERFKNEREECTSDLRNQLDSYVADLRETVGEELAHLASARVKLARRADNVRRAQLKDLRRRVEALLASAVKLIEDLNKDRQHAGQVWEQHLRTALRQRRVAARTATKAVATPRKQTARETAKKRKHARS